MSLFWIIRCSPAQTLSLRETLTALGFDAWTPVVERSYRKARSRKMIRVAEAMLSSFIFVEGGDNPRQCVERLDDLRYLHLFRVWRQGGDFVSVPASALDPLRASEREAAVVGCDNMVKADAFTIGQRGALNAPAFEGLQCTLVDRTRKNLLVLLDGSSSPISVNPALFMPS